MPAGFSEEHGLLAAGVLVMTSTEEQITLAEHLFIFAFGVSWGPVVKNIHVDVETQEPRSSLRWCPVLDGAFEVSPQ
jgi:hypothetical protein